MTEIGTATGMGAAEIATETMAEIAATPEIAATTEIAAMAQSATTAVGGKESRRRQSALKSRHRTSWHFVHRSSSRV